jgi:GntR family transcriptional repressor for pyruvate dehydrogenase complex
MYEARRALEVGVAGLAAERATDDQIATIAEEVTSLFASLDDPEEFVRHDVRFHRAVASASGNPILASLVEMVSTIFHAHRRKLAEESRDLKEAAQMHRAIYHAIRARDPKRARAAMNEHLLLAQEAESAGAGSTPIRMIPTEPPERNRFTDDAEENDLRALRPVRASLSAARPSRQRARLVPTHIR